VVHRARLDAELVRRGLARSREQAAAVIAEGRVRIGGLVATKPATGVDPDASVTVEAGDAEEYVSRGGHKLAGALDAFAAAEPPLEVEARRALDAGASTGGFTDVLLRRGAAHVVAVDVGYGQLAWWGRSDPRVTVLDRTNVRDLDPDTLGEPVDLVVGDLSFISLVTVLPALRVVATGTADYVLMVKPQFEAGRGNVPRGGVVRDPALRAGAIRRVADAAYDLGLGARAVIASPLPGPAGNVEYFLWLTAGAPPLAGEDAQRALHEGPA
jgi:23S rRNA (cytidine1920-2'-O)/16S rRNA (cytidine1409-2'-O)-methyltransferase